MTPRSPQIIALASGKGGVGKTFLAANFARLWGRERNHRVLLIDGDLGLSSLDIFLNLDPDFTMDDFLHEEKPLRQVICPTGLGFDLLPAASGTRELVTMTPEQRRRLMYSLEEISHDYDTVLIDLPPGVSKDTLQLAAVCHVTVLCVTPDPASITDAYAFIKLMKENYREEKFSVVLNKLGSREEGEALFRRLMSVTSDFLGVSLDCTGMIPGDFRVAETVRNRQLLVDRYTSGSTVESVRETARKLLKSGRDRSMWNGGMKALWPLFLQAGGIG